MYKHITRLKCDFNDIDHQGLFLLAFLRSLRHLETLAVMASLEVLVLSS